MRTELYLDQTAQTAETSSMQIFVGRKHILLSDCVRPYIPEAAKTLWTSMVDTVGPGDAGASTHAWLGAEPARRLVVGVLPETCSRHNSPARPHGITHVLQGALPKDGLVHVVVALESTEHATAAVNAIARAAPGFSRKTESTESVLKIHVTLIADDDGEADADALQVLLEEIRYAARLVDMPTAELHTEAFVELARETASDLGVDVSVLEGESLAHAGLGGLWGVGKAASRPPALVILDYTPDELGPDTRTVGWVGKGIVYDTGGLSIKGKTGMPGMKTDMGGAAAVLGAFRAAVRTKAKHRIIALLCLAENAIGPDAVRPDDILRMYSGKTVEINNTDAEGRLVLADGVAYLTRHHKPDVVIDAATLTGAQLVATGHRHAAVVCNDDKLEAIAVKAGKLTGDLVHPLPYCPEFFRKEFKSPVADLKNSVKDRMNAQTSCAAQFIAEHLGSFEGPWLHIDLAGPTRNGERATGFGTTLLVEITNHL
ncbi:MAG: leucyl aminopeptidase family protein [Myxococcota bacterium]|nr:leucyl aminopeptidase family protein [Myxococcota bacterium]